MCFWIIKLKNIKGNSTWTIPRRQNLGWHHTFLNHSILNCCLWMATYWSNTTTSHSITWYRVSNIWIFQIQYSFYILDVWSLPIFSMPFSLTFLPEDSIFSSPLCHTLFISFMNVLKLLIISVNLRMPMVRIYRYIGWNESFAYLLFVAALTNDQAKTFRTRTTALVFAAANVVLLSLATYFMFPKPTNQVADEEAAENK